MKYVALAAMLAAAPCVASAFEAPTGVTVTPVENGFSVPDGGGYGARGVWCAAAAYAQRALHLPATARIYITGPRISGRSPVVFSADPQGPTRGSVFITGQSLRQAGASLNLAHALGFCADAKSPRS